MQAVPLLSFFTKFCCVFFRQLHSDREPIPDVPAIYFVMPSEENIQRITRVSQTCARFYSCSVSGFIAFTQTSDFCSFFCPGLWRTAVWIVLLELHFCDIKTKAGRHRSVSNTARLCLSSVKGANRLRNKQATEVEHKRFLLKFYRAQSRNHSSFVSPLQIFDQYLNFISLEDDMYWLRHQNAQSISYYGKNCCSCHSRVAAQIYLSRKMNAASESDEIFLLLFRNK